MLSIYLEERIEALSESNKQAIQLLEIGAGNGRLSYFLNERLNKNLKN